LILLGISMVANYGFSRWIDASGERKKKVLTLAVVVNLCSLAWFKYSAFIGENLVSLLRSLGLSVESPQYSEWLPLGISFYTFQVIAYLVDLSRGKVACERNFLVFGVFKCFYGQLVAGPIVRAHELIPQLKNKRRFRAGDFYLGLYLMIGGLALKVFVADTLAQFVDYGFDDPSGLEVTTAWLTLYGFAVQILCDFWGYSTVAIGVGLMYGIRLPLNFNLPYHATSIREFWHRWHITLSQWLRDYLYIPLGGNRHHQNRNLFLTMLLGGLWHGASWNFVIWGAGHGLWLVAERLIPDKFGKVPGIKIVKWLVLIHGVCLLWVFFRAPDFAGAMNYFQALLVPSDTIQDSPPDALIFMLLAFLGISVALGKSFTDRRFLQWGLGKQVGVCVLLLFLILAFAEARLDFIYFVF
jgi:alginate O-acetyltransferase complex protein AlgI